MSNLGGIFFPLGWDFGKWYGGGGSALWARSFLLALQMYVTVFDWVTVSRHITGAFSGWVGHGGFPVSTERLSGPRLWAPSVA